MQTRMRVLSLAALLAVVAVPAFAGGPIAQCAPGQAFVWGGGGANIPFNPDQGDLVNVGDNAAAVALVEAAFQVWEDVPTSTASYVNAGPLPVDVTGANVLTYWNEPAPDGLSPVIFDFDGSAGAALGFPTGVLGVAGISWVNTVTCVATEGVALLIGPTFAGNPVAGFDVAVHEFGHYSGLGHSIVNGQIYLGSVGGDNSGPTPNDTFLPIVNPRPDGIVETMYPFYYGPPIGTATLHKDDATALSELYPEPTFATTTATISGSALVGTSPVTGVNVIARNVADPFADAVSAISGDFSVGGDAFVGQWTIQGLTPGADYAVYLDEILAGGFSVPNDGLSPLPGPEDFWNGPSESADSSIDDPSLFTPISAAAGGTASGIGIIFNQPGPGDPLPVGDDGAVQIALPFDFCLQGEAYGSVFVNANGNLTFGAADDDFSESPAELLDGPPRIAGMWDDLNPTTGGSVFYNQTGSSFTVTWEDVPEWFATGTNTFDITLYDNSSVCVPSVGSGDSDSDSDSDNFYGRTAIEIEHRSMDAIDGIVGYSGGLATTSGVETESDLSRRSRNFRRKISGNNEAAIFEAFVTADADYDMNGKRVRFRRVGKAFKDDFERNNSLDRTALINAPFISTDTKRSYTAIAPPAGDIDFYEFPLEEGTTLVAEITRGQLDSVMGLWFCPDNGGGDDDSDSDSDSDRRRVCNEADAIFIGGNDDIDPGVNLLSGFLFEVPLSGTFAIGVTFCCDFDFDGVDAGQGAPFDGGRYILDLAVIDGTLLPLGDDDFIEVPFDSGFSFPYQGASHSSVFVNSNGNLTFGAGDSSFLNFLENVPDFLAGPPRISPLWDDLSPNAGGFVFYKQEPGSFKVTFMDVPEFIATGANTFSVTLGGDGSIAMDYGDLTAVDGLVGVTEGNGAADPGETDLSGAGALSAIGTTYELFTFTKPNDLAGSSVSFDP